MACNCCCGEERSSRKETTELTTSDQFIDVEDSAKPKNIAREKNKNKKNKSLNRLGNRNAKQGTAGMGTYESERARESEISDGGSAGSGAYEFDRAREHEMSDGVPSHSRLPAKMPMRTTKSQNASQKENKSKSPTGSSSFYESESAHECEYDDGESDYDENSKNEYGRTKNASSNLKDIEDIGNDSTTFSSVSSEVKRSDGFKVRTKKVEPASRTGIGTNNSRSGNKAFPNSQVDRSRNRFDVLAKSSTSTASPVRSGGNRGRTTENQTDFQPSWQEMKKKKKEQREKENKKQQEKRARDRFEQKAKEYEQANSIAVQLERIEQRKNEANANREKRRKAQDTEWIGRNVNSPRIVDESDDYGEESLNEEELQEDSAASDGNSYQPQRFDEIQVLEPIKLSSGSIVSPGAKLTIKSIDESGDCAVDHEDWSQEDWLYQDDLKKVSKISRDNYDSSRSPERMPVDVSLMRAVDLRIRDEEMDNFKKQISYSSESPSMKQQEERRRAFAPRKNMQDGTTFGTTMNQSQNIARQGPIIQRTPAPRKPIVKQAERRVITPKPSGGKQEFKEPSKKKQARPEKLNEMKPLKGFRAENSFDDLLERESTHVERTSSDEQRAGFTKAKGRKTKKAEEMPVRKKVEPTNCYKMKNAFDQLLHNSSTSVERGDSVSSMETKKKKAARVKKHADWVKEKEGKQNRNSSAVGGDKSLASIKKGRKTVANKANGKMNEVVESFESSVCESESLNECEYQEESFEAKISIPTSEVPMDFLGSPNGPPEFESEERSEKPDPHDWDKVDDTHDHVSKSHPPPESYQEWLHPEPKPSKKQLQAMEYHEKMKAEEEKKAFKEVSKKKKARPEAPLEMKTLKQHRAQNPFDELLDRHSTGVEMTSSEDNKRGFTKVKGKKTMKTTPPMAKKLEIHEMKTKNAFDHLIDNSSTSVERGDSAPSNRDLKKKRRAKKDAEKAREQKILADMKAQKKALKQSKTKKDSKAVVGAGNNLNAKDSDSWYSEDFGSESLNESELYDGSTEESEKMQILKVTKNFKVGEYYRAKRDFKLEHNQVPKGTMLKVTYVDESGDACFDVKDWEDYEDWIYSDDYENLQPVNDYETSSRSLTSSVSSQANVLLSELSKSQMTKGMRLIASMDIKDLKVEKGKTFVIASACSDDEDICVSVNGEEKWLARKHFEKVIVDPD